MTTFDLIPATICMNIGSQLTGHWENLASILDYDRNAVLTESYNFGNSNNATCAKALIQMMRDNMQPMGPMVIALNQMGMNSIVQQHGLAVSNALGFDDVSPAIRNQIGVKLVSEWRRFIANLRPPIDPTTITASPHIGSYGGGIYGQEVVRYLAEKTWPVKDVIRALGAINQNRTMKFLLNNLPKNPTIALTVVQPPVQVQIIQAPNDLYAVSMKARIQARIEEEKSQTSMEICGPSIISQIKEHLGASDFNTFVNASKGYDMTLKDREVFRMNQEKTLRAALVECGKERSEDQVMLRKRKEKLRAIYQKKIEDVLRMKGQEAISDLNVDMADSAEEKTPEEERKELEDNVKRAMGGIAQANPKPQW